MEMHSTSFQDSHPGTPIADINHDSIKSPLTSDAVPLRVSQMDNIRIDGEASNKVGRFPGSHSGWEVIRQLDDQENWAERTTVISKQDHMLYSDCAKEIVHNLVDSMPSGKDLPDQGGLLGERDDLTESGGSYLPPPSPYNEDHQVQAPPTGNTGEYDYMGEFGDEDFQTSSSQFDMDYLERVSSSTNPSAMSSLARESLFVKFDPLVHRKTPDQVYRQPYPSHISSGDNLLMLDTPPQTLLHHSSPDTNITYNSNSSPHPTHQNLLDFSGDSTPQIDTPQSRNTSRNTTLLSTTPRTVRASSPHAKSLFHISPAMSVSSASYRAANTPRSAYLDDQPAEDELITVLKYTKRDVEEIRQQYEEMLVASRHEHAVESSKQQKRIERLVKELQNLRANSTVMLTDKALAKEGIQNLEDLCTQYQQTEVEILNVYQRLKEDTKVVEQERNQTMKDFASLEKSFTDFHQRYTKSKGLVDELQETVSSLQDYIEKLEAQLNRTKQVNEELQLEVSTQLQEANETYERIKREHASEAAVLKVSLKKLTLQVDGQQKQLEQKEQEKAELTLLCEELMKELGNRN